MNPEKPFVLMSHESRVAVDEPLGPPSVVFGPAALRVWARKSMHPDISHGNKISDHDYTRGMEASESGSKR